MAGSLPEQIVDAIHDVNGRHLLYRLEREAVEFVLEVRIATEDDDPDDPTESWPEDRERVEVGTLRIDALDTTRERDGDVLVFDPTRVTDGIELSDDPILHVRPDAYAVSVERRSGARRA